MPLFRSVLWWGGPVLWRHALEHWRKLVQGRIVGEEADLKLWRILHQFSYVPGCCRTHRRYRRSGGIRQPCLLNDYAAHLEDNRARHRSWADKAQPILVSLKLNAPLPASQINVMKQSQMHWTRGTPTTLSRRLNTLPNCTIGRWNICLAQCGVLNSIGQDDCQRVANGVTHQEPELRLNYEC